MVMQSQSPSNSRVVSLAGKQSGVSRASRGSRLSGVGGQSAACISNYASIPPSVASALRTTVVGSNATLSTYTADRLDKLEKHLEVEREKRETAEKELKELRVMVESRIPKSGWQEESIKKKQEEMALARHRK